MIEINNKIECCGCTACANICTTKCITMVPDEEGFLYPCVNKENCIQCGACDSVCPILTQNKTMVTEENTVSYVLRTRNYDDLMKSTSGGFTTPLANWVFSQGGIVWAATYDDAFHVVHRKFEADSKHFNKTRGSKYVQSCLDDTFTLIKQSLNSSVIVCFIGTTCQVYGLKNYLKKNYDNLITVDLVCHGVPSPKLWEKYLDYQTNRYHSSIRNISFRNKTYGYHSGTMMIEFENGKKYTGSARVDYMLKSFFTEIASRSSCYQCAFKGINRISDFTIYDCWHASELVDGLTDDDKGYTNLMVHSDGGKKILEQIKDKFVLYPVETNRAVDKDGVMILNQPIPHKFRAEYYSNFEQHSLKGHIQKYIKVTAMDRLIERSKSLIYIINLMELMRNLKKRRENNAHH